MKLLLVGFDGATWTLLDRLIVRGVMPNLGRLVAGGARGDLLSVAPTATPAAWTSISTGTNPGKHGIFSFRRRAAGSYEPELINASCRRAVPLWQHFGRAGWPVGVVNVPMTYPVEPVRGFLLSGMETPNSHSAFAYPPELRDEINAAIPGGYRIDVGFRNPKEDYLARVRDLINRRLAAIRCAVRRHPPDLLYAVFVAPDRIQHIFWDLLDETDPRHEPAAAARLRPRLDEVYRDLDTALAELIELQQPELTLLVSDHGFGPLEKTVLLNRWLAEKGYLTLQPVRGRVPTLGDIDWSRTRAYSFSHAGELFINLAGREPRGIVKPGRDYETLRTELLGQLRGLRDTDGDGERVVNAAWRREDLYWGDALELAPDILFQMRGGAYLIRDGFEGGERVFQYFPGETCSGVHRDEGILLLHGRGVRAGGQLPAARLWDVAPTLLHYAGLPVPAAMDGRVISEAFQPGTLPWPPVAALEPPVPAATLVLPWTSRRKQEVPGSRPVTAGAAAYAGYTEPEQAQVEERLRSLGYIE